MARNAERDEKLLSCCDDEDPSSNYLSSPRSWNNYLLLFQQETVEGISLDFQLQLGNEFCFLNTNQSLLIYSFCFVFGQSIICSRTLGEISEEKYETVYFRLVSHFSWVIVFWSGLQVVKHLTNKCY